jgi:hypothetical protein
MRLGRLLNHAKHVRADCDKDAQQLRIEQTEDDEALGRIDLIPEGIEQSEWTSSQRGLITTRLERCIPVEGGVEQIEDSLQCGSRMSSAVHWHMSTL